MEAMIRRLPFAWPIVVLAAAALFAWATAQMGEVKPAEQHFQTFLSRLGLAQFPEAHKEIEEAVRLSPNNAYYISGQGVLHERMMQTRFEPESFILSRLTFGDEDTKRAEAAISCYEKAIEMNPNDGVFRHNLGWLYCFLNRREKALDCFNEAIKIDSANSLYRVSLGLFYEQSGRPELAGDQYRVAVRLSPAILDSHFFSDFERRSPSAAAQVVADTISHLEASSRQSANPVLKARLGKMYLYSKRPEAMETLRQVTTELTSLARPWLYLGRLYEDQSNDDEARRCYEKAVFLDASDFLSPLELGRLHDRYGRKPEAIRYYQSAIYNWLSKASASSRRASRIYLTAHVIHDDVVPGGLLSYVEPSFDLARACLRLSALCREAGNIELANYYESLSKRPAF
jgi:tetratricopeptide (TPR) repeat protein